MAGRTETTPLWTMWRAASLAAGWPQQDVRWWSTEVLMVADAMRHRRDVRAAGAALGRRRAGAGVTLEETRLDARVAADVAALSADTAAALVDAVTDGWVDSCLGELSSAGCLDAATSLTTAAYLLTRLRELYVYEQVRARSAARTHILAIVRCQAAPAPLDRDVRVSALHRSMRAVLRVDDTIARVGPHTVAALIERRGGLDVALQQLRAEVTGPGHEGRAAAASMWTEALPEDVEQLTTRIRGLHR